MEENLPNTNQNMETPPQETTPVVNPQPQPIEEQPKSKRKLSAVKIITFIIILVLLTALGYLVYQNNQLKNQISYKHMETPIPSLEPISTPDPTANFTTCSNDIINVSIKHPGNYQCNSEDLSDADGQITLTSGVLSITISSLGRGGPCSSGILASECTGEPFFTNDQIDTRIYTKGSEYGEIFGSPEGGPWISIGFTAGTNRHIDSLSNSEAEELKTILSTFQYTDSEFVCPDTKVIDCSPCEGGPCPLMFPMYCSKGSAQYNWIVENCPDVTFIGLE